MIYIPGEENDKTNTVSNDFKTGEQSSNNSNKKFTIIPGELINYTVTVTQTSNIEVLTALSHASYTYLEKRITRLIQLPRTPRLENTVPTTPRTQYLNI